MPRGTLCKQTQFLVVYRAFTVYGGPFQNLRLKTCALILRAAPLSLATTRGIVSVPQVTKMFQFTWFPSNWLCVHQSIQRHAPLWVSPFGYLRLMRLHTPTRSFSQCTASFVGA